MLTDVGQAGTKVWICTKAHCTNVKPIFCQTQCCRQLKSQNMRFVLLMVLLGICVTATVHVGFLIVNKDKFPLSSYLALSIVTFIVGMIVEYIVQPIWDKFVH